MEPNNSSQIDHFKKSKTDSKSKPIYFLGGFFIISFIFAFIIGGIYFGKNEKSKQLNETNLKEQVKISSEDIPDSPDKWKAFELKTLGIEVKLPEKLAKQGEWSEKVIQSSDKGSIICFTNKNLEGAVCSGDDFSAGGTSTDFAEGRGGTFTDLQGFKKENEKIYIKSTGGNSFELTNAKFKELNNSNGIEIVKVLGENQNFESGEFPKSGTPGDGYLGAIINTKNAKYPGIAIQLKIDSQISEYEFDQILESIKYLN